MQLSKKQKDVSKFFIAFLKSTSNFEHFEKKDGPHSLSISKIIYSEIRDYLIEENVLFQNSLRESATLRHPNNAEICTAALSSDFFTFLR